MTSSTDMPFSRAVFPALSRVRDAASDAIAYSHGHTAGYTAGIRMAATEADKRRGEMESEHAAALDHAVVRTDQALATLGAAARALELSYLPVLTSAQDALAYAALDLAEAILGHELSDSENSARAALTRALAVPASSGTRTVRLNPSDLAVLIEDSLTAAGVIFVADETVARGDAFTEFETGYLDARIATALERAREALVGEGA